MKLEYTEGCTVTGLDIDGDSFHTMTVEEQKIYFSKCLSWYKHNAIKDKDFQDFIIWLVEKYGDFEFQYHCEECGDSVYKTTIEI